MKENIRTRILEWVEADRADIIALCSCLVQCKTPSTTGDTREIARVIREFLSARGIESREIAACKTMPNVLSSVEMARDGRHLMLNGHLDVMPAGKEPGWTDDPWSGAVHDGRIWGRGVSDMKAGVAAMLFAYSYLHRLRSELSGRLSLSLVADEETGWGRGTGFLFDTVPEEMTADAVLTGEPSDVGAVSFASKGFISLGVKIAARGAIAGYSNESRNAVEVAADLIRDLKELEKTEVALPEPLAGMLKNPGWVREHEALRGKGHATQLSRVTVDVCTIKGGSLATVIPADCAMTLAVVVPQGTDSAALVSRIREITARYPEATLDVYGVDEGEFSPPDGELSRIIQDTAEGLGWRRPVPTPDIALSDMRYWRYRGIPAYWYGAGGESCSAANESVSVEELLHVVRVHALAVAEYLGA